MKQPPAARDLWVDQRVSPYTWVASGHFRTLAGPISLECRTHIPDFYPLPDFVLYLKSQSDVRRTRVRRGNTKGASDAYRLYYQDAPVCVGNLVYGIGPVYNMGVKGLRARGPGFSDFGFPNINYFDP